MLRGRGAECRLPFHQQHVQPERHDYIFEFEAGLFLELVRPGTAKAADSQRFYRPTTSPIAWSRERDRSAILIPHAPLDGIDARDDGDLALSRRL